MRVITARGVNDALLKGVSLVRGTGVREESRNGPVLRVPGPVATVTALPAQRVLLHPWRDANPFFHVVEALWMLAGRDDLGSLTPYARQMREYSDDGGVTQPAAYGRRWRGWFGKHGQADADQLDWAVGRLRADPGDRRVVIQMWDAYNDRDAADAGSRDVPCNLVATPYAVGGALHLSVYCRSNDLVWGAHGANAVHFSVLLEYLAARAGLGVGTLTQVSVNYHGYLSTLPTWEEMTSRDLEPYATRGATTTPLFGLSPDDVDPLTERGERQLREDLTILFDEGPFAVSRMARWAFLRRVAVPMMLAHRHWRDRRGEERYLGALEILAQMPALCDWRLAAEDWVRRRHARWAVKADGGVPHDT